MRDTLRPSAALDNRPLVPCSKVLAWKSIGASPEVLQDLEYGIHVFTSDHVPAASADNYASLAERPGLVNLELEALRDTGKIEQVRVGEVRDTIISPMGQIPKTDPSKIRLIHDLSLFVNQHVRVRNMSLPTIEDFLKWVTPGAYMWKRDWKGGYTQFWVHGGSRRLLGFEWNGSIWRYCVLPFGLSSAPADFCQFSELVRDTLRRLGIVCWTYIDDLYGVHDTQLGAVHDFEQAGTLHDYLQIDEAKDKAVAPCQIAVILGYVVDSVASMVSLPATKVEKILALCVDFVKRDWATLREIQKLIGNLVFAARVVRGGWIFLSRLFPLLRVNSRSNTSLRLTNQFRADVRWWLHFLRGWHGIAAIPTWRDVHVFCDASNRGWGAWCGDLWAAGSWSSSAKAHHINWKEMVAIKSAVSRWAHLWHGARVFIHSDNRAAVAICSKGHSRSPKLAKIMREIFWSLARVSCEVRVLHIAGVFNVRADALSRLDLLPGISIASEQLPDSS